MAEEVFLSEGKLTARGGAGIAPTALAGGDELFFAEITGNFASTAATFIDVTGLTGTLTVPEGPYVVELYAPLFNTQTGITASLQVVTGSTVLVSDSFVSPANNTGVGLYMRSRFPSSMHTAVPGQQVTYKAQMKSSTTAHSVSIFVDLGSRLNPAYIRAFRS